MGFFSKDIKTMDDPVRAYAAGHLLNAEYKILKALPGVIKKVTDPTLKQGLTAHLEETKSHVERLKQVFKLHGADVKAVTCPAIDGIIKETDEISGEVADKEVLDAALIAAAQAVEHYEITRYGSLCAWASNWAATIAPPFSTRHLRKRRALTRS